MRNHYVLAAALGALLSPLAAVAEETKPSRFTGDALTGWTVAGDAALDATQNHGDAKGKSLKVGPGGLASWTLRADDGGGTGRVLDLRRWERRRRPQGPPSRRAMGHRDRPAANASSPARSTPRTSPAAKRTASPTILPVRPTRRPSSATSNTSALNARRCGGSGRSTSIQQRVCACRLTAGDVNAEKQRFDPAKSKVTGFARLVIYGDEPGQSASTVWLDDATVTLGGQMSATPATTQAAAALPQVVPDADPPLAGPPVALNAAMMSAHPRLLFGPADLPRLRILYASEQGAFARASMEKLLPQCVPPTDAKFLTDATDAQRQGFWRLPTVAMHYAMTGDKTSFDRTVGFLKVLLALPHWETDDYLDCEMSAANIMLGAAFAFDVTYNELPPDFREQFRQKLWWQARAMYYGGHLMKVPGVHFWQGDPQNNHRCTTTPA